MSQAESIRGRQHTAEFTAFGKKRLGELTNAQEQCLEHVKEMTEQWVECVQSEILLATELASKLISARSIPDAMAACYDWSRGQVKLMGDYGKQVVDSTRKALDPGAQWLSRVPATLSS